MNKYVTIGILLIANISLGSGETIQYTINDFWIFFRVLQNNRLH